MKPRVDIVALGAGFLFACGLAIGGMTDPAKVLAFLDVAGDWDPSLAFVMAGAVGTYAPLRAWIVRRRRAFRPRPSRIDRRLVIGAALFGLGWGLVGYCPGPALVAVASLHGAAITCATAMLVGMFAYSRLARRR